ncbi:UDP-sugar pyrophosphorylase [Actinidia rufa]|uniref:UDP-sugar pyrophosphorylase n=1 Tax=Actinidia rufa TaxID=165716 RepID=A0A7J0EH30_9ERIC|nr:UDP-sugar pyrophosphorylase [Actinidia rufa]
MASTAESTAQNLAKLDIGGDLASSAPNLQKNLSLLSPDQIELAKMLLEMGQSHLFEHWPEPGVDDDEKKAFLNQIRKPGKNPFDGFTPSVPSGESLTFGDDNFIQFEEAGVREGRNAAFVLVAGGLGERLGYNGIKVALPIESTTGTCFLQHYIRNRIAYFGMLPSQVKLLKQEKVACLDDNDARLAMDPHNNYRIQTKPHGHGDVHSLLYSSGLLNIWCDAGLRWVLFFQDTNGLLFKALPASLGVSATNQYQVNSLAVHRKAKEAIGGIAKLTHADGRTMVINVEYNQLDPLLRATGFPDGDVNCETGYSPFPGNINQLILELGPYIEELTKTRGAIKEFVNPK